MSGLIITPGSGLAIASSVFNVVSEGAVGNGLANDTKAFAQALAAASAAGGGPVVVPPLTYLIDPITVPTNCALVGMTRGPYGGLNNPLSMVTSPTLLANSGGSALITMEPGSSVRDFTVYYPDQVAPTASTPTAYPPAILIPFNSGGGCNISGITTVNAFEGINVGAGHVIIQDCNLGAYNYGINIDGAEDYVFLSNVFIEPTYDTLVGLTFPQNIDTSWVNANGYGIICRRVDSLHGVNIGIFGKFCGFLLGDTQQSGLSTTAGYGKLANVDIDTVMYGILAQSTNNIGGGFKFSGLDIGGFAIGSANPQYALAMITGGNETPLITWAGGSMRGTWQSTNGLSLQAGQAYLSDVRGLQPQGKLTAPSVPGSTTPQTNTFGVPVRVFVAGGTVSAIAIGGNATGLTSGMFVLAPSETITLTYSAAPTWTWFGL